MNRQPIVELILCASFTFAAGCDRIAEEKKRVEAAKQAVEAARQVKEAGNKASKALEEGAESMEDALQKMKQALSDQIVEPVSIQELKALLPESLPDMKRVDSEGEKSGALGMKISRARAVYRSDDRSAPLLQHTETDSAPLPSNFAEAERGRGKRDVTIDLTDVGSVKGIVATGVHAWTLAGDFDRETEDSFEKSARYKGYKAYEKYTNSSQEGSIHVFVADRFIVEVSGKGVKMSNLKTALDRVDVGKLESMKSMGVQENKSMATRP